MNAIPTMSHIFIEIRENLFFDTSVSASHSETSFIMQHKETHTVCNFLESWDCRIVTACDWTSHVLGITSLGANRYSLDT